jgi:hypothetical protein
MSQSLTSVHVREDLPPVSPELVFRVSSLTPSWQNHAVQVASLEIAAQLRDVLDSYDRAQELGVDHYIERWDGSAWVEIADADEIEVESALEFVDRELTAAHRRLRRPPSRWSMPCPENVSDEDLDAQIAARFEAENPDLHLDAGLLQPLDSSECAA